MKKFKIFALGSILMLAGCGATAPNTEGEDSIPPAIEVPQEEAPAVIPPEPKGAFTVGCAENYPEGESPVIDLEPCDVDQLTFTVGAWNEAAQAQGLDKVFELELSNPNPDIMIYMTSFVGEAKAYQETTQSTVAWVQGGSFFSWKYVARALGFAAGLPVNPDQHSIMREHYAAEEVDEVGILCSDIAGLKVILGETNP